MAPAAGTETVKLKREFGIRSAFGIAFAFISPIVALYGIFALAFSAMGPAVLWAFGAVILGQLLVALVFAQHVSRWPYEGSIYQWSRRLCGETYGWFCGWAYIWTLIITIAAASYIAASFIPVVLGIDPFSTLEQLLVSFAIVIVATSINALGRRAIAVVAAVSIAAEVVGSIGVGGTLLIFHREHSFGELFHTAGAAYGPGPFMWATVLAAVAFIGWSFVGFESAGTIAEEVKNPSRDIPKAMILSLLGVGSVVMFSALGLILAIPDYQAVLSGNVADPVADTITTHLGTGVTQPLFAIFTLGFIAAIVVVQTSASRMIWSFARDDVLPGARYLKRVTARKRLPMVAIVTTAVLGMVLLLSTLHGPLYNTLVNLTAGGFFTAFAFPVIGVLIVRIRRRPLPVGPFNLGRWSELVYWAAGAWMVFELVNIFWPRATDQPWYLQYGIMLTVGAVGLLGVLAWLAGRDKIAAADLALHSFDEVEDAAPEAGVESVTGKASTW
ncbi:APC family permease [Capillimicrobium parvum]|uniref:APC family permease n=1 Tax=Capillimicrobium parvum TaxID=2884022 RepID=UPI00216B507F|nr:amino acid permease [Capillimicrobium parvum]